MIAYGLGSARWATPAMNSVTRGWFSATKPWSVALSRTFATGTR